MIKETFQRNPPAIDALAMRTSAKEKLAACANIHNLFHRVCLLHRLNRRHSGDWHGSSALDALRKT